MAVVLLNLALLWLESAPAAVDSARAAGNPIVRLHTGPRIALMPSDRTGGSLVALLVNERWQLRPLDPCESLFPATRELLRPTGPLFLPN